MFSSPFFPGICWSTDRFLGGKKNGLRNGTGKKKEKHRPNEETGVLPVEERKKNIGVENYR